MVVTAPRPGEARGAQWSEMDLDAVVWTVSAERMKALREHRVPPPSVDFVRDRPSRTTTDFPPYLWTGRFSASSCYATNHVTKEFTS